jgi:hypothetical protein
MAFSALSILRNGVIKLRMLESAHAMDRNPLPAQNWQMTRTFTAITAAALVHSGTPCQGASWENYQALEPEKSNP